MIAPIRQHFLTETEKQGIPKTNQEFAHGESLHMRMCSHGTSRFNVRCAE